MEHIGKRIKKILDNEGLSYDQFGEKLKVSGSSVGYWIEGRNEPRKKTVNKMLSEFPHVDKTWLIDGVGHMIKKPSAFSESQENYRNQIEDLKKEINSLKAIVKSQELLLKHYTAELAKLRKK